VPRETTQHLVGKTKCFLNVTAGGSVFIMHNWIWLCVTRNIRVLVECSRVKGEDLTWDRCLHH